MVKIKINNKAVRELRTGPAARADITRRAKAIEDACNAQSSWGGYHSGPENNRSRAAANVWAEGPGAVDNNRSNRMIRNLDRGR